MYTPQTQDMKKLILAGTYAQYRDWIVLHNANQRAAVYVEYPDRLRGWMPDDVEIVLVGTFHDNPAYMSPEYLDLISRQRSSITQMPLAS
jgi:hypothetical protein